MSNTTQLVQELVKKHGKTRNSLMAVLQGVVQEERYLSEDERAEKIRKEKELRNKLK